MQNFFLNDFPKHPFWEFSLAIYADPKIKETCLYLQDHYGLNINLLLFCCWVTQVHFKELTTSDIKKAHQAIAEWNKNITCKLRDIRKQYSKQIIRKELLHIELHAEYIEQMLLSDSLIQQKTTATKLSSPALVQANLRAYLQFSATQLSETDKSLLDNLITATSRFNKHFA